MFTAVITVNFFFSNTLIKESRSLGFGIRTFSEPNLRNVRQLTVNEKIWNKANYDTLTKILARIPIHWRFFIKHRIFEMMGNQETLDSGEKISTYFEGLLTEFPQLEETLRKETD